MDRLESLGTTLSQITLYDIKSMYNQAKNVVLNVSEMEAKVREATNDEPWGASSSLMQEIAAGTFHFQNFNEIMPCIYARFMEKEARQWRQIYKALQLLEYLIKHGSERVVDDARSHVSTIKMLRNFHYIDEKGKDEGSNVRNRARELCELLADVEKIRTERRKAKTNKHKFVGTGNDAMSFSSGGSRYGGFGNDTLGGGDDGDGRGWNGRSSGFKDETRRGGFQEYNAGDDEIPHSRRSEHAPDGAASTSAPSAPPKAKEPVKEVNLLEGLDDDDVLGSGSTTTTTKLAMTDKALPILGNVGATSDGDDDFTDFVAAPTTTTTSAPSTMSPIPPPNAKFNLMEMLNSTPTSPASRPVMTMHAPSGSFSQVQPPLGGALNANFGFGSIMSPTSTSQRPTLQPSTTSTQSIRPASTTTTATKQGGFDDLWAMSLGSSPSTTGAQKVGGTGKSIKDLEKEKAAAGIWASAQKPQTPNSGVFGSFVTSTSIGPVTNGGGGGADDLLL